MTRFFVPLILVVCFVGSARAAADDPAAFERLVPAGANVEKVAGGMTFTEGPVWMDDGSAGYLVFSDIPTNRLMKWQPQGGLRVFRKDSNAANGNARDAKGRLVTCEHTTRRVTRLDDPAKAKPETKARPLVEKYNGKKFNSPNDLAIKSDGSIWFTDPPYGMGDNAKEQPGNFVYRLDAETKDVKPVIKTVKWPNGICFSPDEKRLYVANSDEHEPVILAFDVKDDGTVGDGKELARIAKGAPDGIKCDAEGNIWSSAAGGVEVFSPGGKPVGRIQVPEPAANLCFGGEDGKTLFITARTSLYAVKTNVRGSAGQNDATR